MKKIIIISFLALATFACDFKQEPKNDGGNIDSTKVEQTQPTPQKTIKSATDLEPFFSEQKKTNMIIVQPKTVAANGNGVYCYFRLKENKASGLRMRIQYWSEKYADADQYSFDVDGKTYNYIANRNKETSGNVAVVENEAFYWFDNNVNKTDQQFLETLAKATDARLKLIDRATNQSIATITLSDEEKQNIGRTLDYYVALNGATIPKEGMVNIRQ